MTDFLYMDTARVGRPSRRTIQAGTDSLLLAAEEGGSAYFERFLRDGLSKCPTQIATRFPGLQSWSGIAKLKSDLRTLAGGPDDLPVLLANRSAQLMTFATWLFFPRCQHVLTCDLGWPAYQSLLEKSAAESAGYVTCVPLAEMVFAGQATAEDVSDRMIHTYIANRCDSLFLPAVNNLGVQLPIEPIVRRIEAIGNVRLVVVDGSQQFCHTAPELATDYCDLYLTGCHKWLSGHHPMGVGFYGRRRSREFIDTMLDRLLEFDLIDDPLLRFVKHHETGRAEQYTETVNLAGLFTAQAAVAEALCEGGNSSATSTRFNNYASTVGAVDGTGWRVRSIHPTLRSAILLAVTERQVVRDQSAALIREAFRNNNIGLTSYDDGLARISMPTHSQFSTDDLTQISAAFRAVA